MLFGAQKANVIWKMFELFVLWCPKGQNILVSCFCVFSKFLALASWDIPYYTIPYLSYCTVLHCTSTNTNINIDLNTYINLNTNTNTNTNTILYYIINLHCIIPYQNETCYWRKSLIEGNPLWRETPHRGRPLRDWTPLWREIPNGGKSIIQGKPLIEGSLAQGWVARQMTNIGFLCRIQYNAGDRIHSKS